MNKEEDQTPVTPKKGPKTVTLVTVSLVRTVYRGSPCTHSQGTTLTSVHTPP